jgi:negative regulator of sigma E activity
VSGAARPVLRVVAGDATPEEIAAVVAAVAAAPAPEQNGEPDATSVWAARGHAHRHVRAPFTPSRDGWRTSFWPR